jgi:hypothetical protein
VEAANGSIVNFAVAFAIIKYGIFAMAVHALVTWPDERVDVDRRKPKKAQWHAQMSPTAAPASSTPALTVPTGGV